MFRKMNNKKLLVVFVVLALGVAALLITNEKKGERNFTNQLVEFDTTEAQAIYITPKKDTDRGLAFEKVNGNWVVVRNNEDYKADQDKIAELLNTLITLKPLSLTANSKEKWEQFEVTDSLGTRVVVKGKKDKTLADLIIGKFEYTAARSPQNQMMQSYGQRPQVNMQTQVRNADEKQVYLVDGFLNMTFNRQWQEFRDNTIINSASNKWKRLSFNYPADSSFTMVREQGQWMVNGEAADSASVVRYLNKLDFQSGRNFADGYKPNGSPVYTLNIEGDNMSAIQVDAYYNPADSAYYLHSSENKDVYFSDETGNIVKNIFVSPKTLISKN